MNDPVSGYALSVARTVVVSALRYAVLRRQSVDDTQEFTTAAGRARLGLTTRSVAATWTRAEDDIDDTEYGGILVTPQ